MARVALMKYYKLCGLNNRNGLSQTSGSWKSDIKVSEGLVSSEGCEKLSQWPKPVTQGVIIAY